MAGRIVFVAGVAVGYVLGARAGRRRYEQIKAAADRVWNDKHVQQGVDQVVGGVQGFVKDKDLPGAVIGQAKKVATKVTGKSATDEPSPSI